MLKKKPHTQNYILKAYNSPFDILNSFFKTLAIQTMYKHQINGTMNSTRGVKNKQLFQWTGH